jgi:hypothetical protein
MGYEKRINERRRLNVEKPETNKRRRQGNQKGIKRIKETTKDPQIKGLFFLLYIHFLKHFITRIP